MNLVFLEIIILLCMCGATLAIGYLQQESTYTEARKYCFSMNKSLPSDTDPLVHARILHEMSSLNVLATWLTLQRRSVSWRYLGNTNTTVAEPVRGEEPGLNCAYVRYGIEYAAHCLDKKQYICGQQGEECTNCTGDTCIRFRSNCGIIIDIKQNWFSARFRCKERNSSLLIPSKALQIALVERNLQIEEFWIGLYKAQWYHNTTHGETEITTSYWAEKGDTAGGHDWKCAYIRNGIWHPSSCSDKRKFLCMYEETGFGNSSSIVKGVQGVLLINVSSTAHPSLVTTWIKMDAKAWYVFPTICGLILLVGISTAIAALYRCKYRKQRGRKSAGPTTRLSGMSEPVYFEIDEMPGRSRGISPEEFSDRNGCSLHGNNGESTSLLEIHADHIGTHKDTHAGGAKCRPSSPCSDIALTCSGSTGQKYLRTDKSPSGSPCSASGNVSDLYSDDVAQTGPPTDRHIVLRSGTNTHTGTGGVTSCSSYTSSSSEMTSTSTSGSDSRSSEIMMRYLKTHNFAIYSSCDEAKIMVKCVDKNDEVKPVM